MEWGQVGGWVGRWMSGYAGGAAGSFSKRISFWGGGSTGGGGVPDHPTRIKTFENVKDIKSGKSGTAPHPSPATPLPVDHPPQDQKY